jgi:hypothetical protein
MNTAEEMLHFFFTLTFEKVCSERHDLAILTRRESLPSLLGWVLEKFGVYKIDQSTLRMETNPDHPSHSQSLHSLSYFG